MTNIWERMGESHLWAINHLWSMHGNHHGRCGILISYPLKCFILVLTFLSLCQKNTYLKEKFVSKKSLQLTPADWVEIVQWNPKDFDSII